MRRCIVHIGMHKTGSKSIQRALSSAPAGPDLRYVDLGSPNHSMPLSSAFLLEPWTHRVHVGAGRTRAQVEAERSRVLAQMESQFDSPHGTYILSGEAICTFSRVELEALRSWLASRVDEIRIVGYVRPVKGFMASSLQQRVRGGQRELSVDDLYPNFRKKFAKFDDVFGRTQVSLRKYSPASFEANCVVRDFVSHIGIELAVPVDARANASLSRNALALLFAYRRSEHQFGAGATVPGENRRLVRLLSRLEGGQVSLANSLLHPVIQANRSDLEWMEARLGEPLRDGLDDRDGPDAITSDDDLLSFEPQAVKWLAEQVGAEIGADPAAIDAKRVADWMHRLRARAATEYAATVARQDARRQRMPA